MPYHSVENDHGDWFEGIPSYFCGMVAKSTDRGESSIACPCRGLHVRRRGAELNRQRCCQCRRWAIGRAGERLDVLPLELGLLMGAQGGMNDASY